MDTHSHSRQFRLDLRPLAVAVMAMATVSGGCAISDYSGWVGHMTESEAKIIFVEMAFSTEDPRLTGTYSYTVKYDFREVTRLPPRGAPFPKPIDIYTYRNPVFGSFSRDGCVDRDGDEVQGRPGMAPFQGCFIPAEPTGKFDPKWWYVDRAQGCQLQANFKQEFEPQPKNPAPMVFCHNAPREEIDKDLSLQGDGNSNLKQAFASLDDLTARIWSGELGHSFTMDVTKLTFENTEAALAYPLTMMAQHNGIRVTAMAVDLNSPGGQEAIRAILDGTQDEVPITLAIEFAGGMRLKSPSTVTVMFDHDQLLKLLAG